MHVCMCVCVLCVYVVCVHMCMYVNACMFVCACIHEQVVQKVDEDKFC